MNATISYKGHDRGAQALLLDELAAALNTNDLNCKMDTSSPNVGEKGDFATGLILAGLTVQAMGTFVNALTFYFNGRPSYTVAIKRGATTLTIGNLSEKDATRMLAAAGPSEDIEVEVREGK